MPKKRTNPRNRPASKADVDKAFHFGIETALKTVVYTLKEYGKFTEDEMKEFQEHFNYQLDSMLKGYITMDDIEGVLNDEYNTQVAVTR